MKKTQGFIALTSVLILSVIFLSVTISMATRAISGASLTTASIERDTAETHAEACVEQALLELQRTVDYNGGDSIELGTGSCEIRTILGSGVDNRTLQVESVVGSHVYRAEMIIESISPELLITSFERVTQF
jgi:hypothetical protein